MKEFQLEIILQNHYRLQGNVSIEKNVMRGTTQYGDITGYALHSTVATRLLFYRTNNGAADGFYVAERQAKGLTGSYTGSWYPRENGRIVEPVINAIMLDLARIALTPRKLTPVTVNILEACEKNA